jgi:hypothetical protein
VKKISTTRKATTTAIAVAGLLFWGAAAPAAESPANDCLIGLKGTEGAVLAAGKVTCIDGAACDADGQKNNSCTIRVQACVNLEASGCTARTIKSAKVTPPARGITITPSGATAVCGSPADIVLPLRKNGAKPSKPAKLRAVGVADVKPKASDSDKVALQCLPCTTEDCGGGGGGACPANPNGGPKELTFTVGPTFGDLDTGYSGRSHNFSNVPGAVLNYCLTGCDGTTNPVCQGSGATGQGTKNGPAFGPPLPLFSSNVAVCVVNRHQDANLQTVFNVQTGKFDAMATPLRLLSDTYQGTANSVCPRCIAGKCDSGRREGQNCTVQGTVIVNNPPNINDVPYPTSSDCLPSTSALLGTPNVALPLTTETATLQAATAGAIPCPGQANHDECGTGSCTVACPDRNDFKGGKNQTCCSNAQQTACFPTNTAEGASGQIVRVGSVTAPTPVWPDPTYPKTFTGVFASAFCIPPTTNIQVDGTAGLAGPGASLLEGTAVVQ